MTDQVYAESPAPAIVLVQGPPMQEEIYLSTGRADVMISEARFEAWQAYQATLKADVATTIRSLAE